MPSFPGPYQVEINYVGDGREHKLRCDCVVDGSPTPGTDMGTINVIERSGSPVGLTSAVGSLITLIKTRFHSDTEFTDFTLWKFTAGTYERLYIGTSALNIVGTASGALKPAYYEIYTMRNIGGGTTRLTLLEGAVESELKRTYSNATAAQQNIFDYLVGTTGWVYGRDNTYPIAPLHVSHGQNERLWRKVYRP